MPAETIARPRGGDRGRAPNGSCLDLFAAAGEPLPLAPVSPEDLVLAQDAVRTIVENLPNSAATEAFLFAHVYRLDGTGPHFGGTVLDCWGRVRRILAIAWQGRPKSQRPAILSMKLPKLDPVRRKRIAKLAAALNNEARP